MKVDLCCWQLIAQSAERRAQIQDESWSLLLISADPRSKLIFVADSSLLLIVDSAESVVLICIPLSNRATNRATIFLGSRQAAGCVRGGVLRCAFGKTSWSHNATIWTTTIKFYILKPITHSSQLLNVLIVACMPCCCVVLLCDVLYCGIMCVRRIL